MCDVFYNSITIRFMARAISGYHGNLRKNKWQWGVWFQSIVRMFILYLFKRITNIRWKFLFSSNISCMDWPLNSGALIGCLYHVTAVFNRSRVSCEHYLFQFDLYTHWLFGVTWPGFITLQRKLQVTWPLPSTQAAYHVTTTCFIDPLVGCSRSRDRSSKHYKQSSRSRYQ